MRLSERFEDKVKLAIARLPILQVERSLIDYEIIPTMVQAGKELITTFTVALFMPCGPDDYVSHLARPDNPYAAQEVIDAMVRDLYGQVQEERARNLKVPGQSALSPGGLVLP